MTDLRIQLFAIAFAGWLSGAAGAQTAVQPPAPVAQQLSLQLDSQTLRPVDPAVGDMGPLSASLRQLASDLAEPSGFDQVYRVPGRDDLLMRVNGGIYAVFPRSTYLAMQIGTVPLIPPSTVFHIGPPTALTLPPTAPGSQGPSASAAAADNVNRADLRIDTFIAELESDPRSDPEIRTKAEGAAILPVGFVPGSMEPPMAARVRREHRQLPDQPPSQAALDAQQGPMIVSDAAYRQRRLHELLTRAASRHE